MKQEKQAFESKKEQLAIDFLAELDSTITGGRISELTRETGGITIFWNKKLNTTAGMAQWKKEPTRTTTEDGSTCKTYRHCASIQLATKIIDEEQRLLNTLAHEFCHLANFMISEIKNNPHGKEFKAWYESFPLTY
jgi:SprT-like family